MSRDEFEKIYWKKLSIEQGIVRRLLILFHICDKEDYALKLFSRTEY